MAFLGGRNWLWAGQPCCNRDLATWLSLCVCLFQSFLPDPILRLKGVIGFGGHSTKWVRSSVLLLGPTTSATPSRHLADAAFPCLGCVNRWAPLGTGSLHCCGHPAPPASTHTWYFLGAAMSRHRRPFVL